MAPIALAQTTDAPTAEAQAAAPSWNDSNDLMVLPKTEKAPKSKPKSKQRLQSQ
ncbi:MAG: hypothetical protein IPJ49_19155 [Candidatus Obscuribacter sp.]|nr:hypothetical protein [Candidatus Obscuribacter sp.]